MTDPQWQALVGLLALNMLAQLVCTGLVLYAVMHVGPPKDKK